MGGSQAGAALLLHVTFLAAHSAVRHGQRSHDIRRSDIFSDHVRQYVAFADADTDGFADAHTVADGVSLRERYADGVANDDAVAQPVRHSESLANLFWNEDRKPDTLANAHPDADAFGQPDSVAVPKLVHDWYAELNRLAVIHAIIHALCDAEPFGDAERLRLALAVSVGHAEPFGHANRIANADAESESVSESEPQPHPDAVA